MAKTARSSKATKTIAKDLLSEAIIKGLQEKKAKHIVVLNLKGISGAVADKFIVCHGDSSTHVEGLTRSVDEIVENEVGEAPAHVEGRQLAHWILMDYINVVVHIFQSDYRDYYGIERLWADADIEEIKD
ncbi:MAG: ribosome silencing factor [Bacteroidota bacterium]